MKLFIKALALCLLIQTSAFAESGILFNCVNDNGDEKTFEYMYDDKNVKVSSTPIDYRLGEKVTISWFHPYCSISYTYEWGGSPYFKFIGGGGDCEGEKINYDCAIQPLN